MRSILFDFFSADDSDQKCPNTSYDLVQRCHISHCQHCHVSRFRGSNCNWK